MFASITPFSNFLIIQPSLIIVALYERWSWRTTMSQGVEPRYLLKKTRSYAVNVAGNFLRAIKRRIRLTGQSAVS